MANGWTGTFLMKPLGKSELLVDCQPGTLWAPLRLPTAPVVGLASSTNRDPFSFVFLKKKLPSSCSRVHVTRSNTREKCLLEVQWPVELQTLAGHGDGHREREGLPPASCRMDRA